MTFSHRAIAAAFLLLSVATADVFISEISDKGTTGVCGGEDWVELFNAGEAALDLGLEGYVLHDDNGIDGDESFSFPGESVIEPQSFMLLCTEQTIEGPEDGTTSMMDPMSPQFGIGGDDTVYLTRIRRADPNATGTPGFSISTSRNGDVYEIISRVKLPNTDDAFDVTYAWDAATGMYNYTGTPTPGAPNVMSRVLSTEERNEKFKEELIAQNEQGAAFFNMDDRGLPVADGMDDILDLAFTMDEPDYQYLVVNKTFEQYRAYQSAVLSKTDGTEILTLSQPGRIRAKGQSSLYMAECLETETFPFQVEMGTNETLYGVERIYLRNHIDDYSYMRDWAYNRMLARFGLPFLRTRKVRVTINGNLHGFYSMMEAPDQDYVFRRSFPDFNPQEYGLFKVKSFGVECGSYTPEEIAIAEQRLDETATPPYAFQRGEHKPPVERLGRFAIDGCIENYNNELWDRDWYDVILAWLRYDRSCADMLVGEGLVDQDLGTSGLNKEIKEWITKDYSDEHLCDEQCANSNFADRVDTENWLKSFAFYAVTMNSDSPLVNGNNFYVAMSGSEVNGGTGGWKLVPYDFNLPGATYCHDDLCNSRLAHWSIARPTCTSLEKNNLAGPLLTDETLHAQYLEYVREFTETIYGNASFVEQLEQHAAAQDEFVRVDFWSVFGAFYNKELTPESGTWDDDGSGNFPLLPTMKARTEDVRAQLAAIDSGAYPRGPFVGVHGDNEPWEPCADWRMVEANRSACEEGCQYVGCQMEGWTVESYCEEDTGKCFHGDYDEMCRNIFDGYKYEGLEDTEDGRPTFCRFTEGLPVRTSECPAVGAVVPSDATLGSSGTRSGIRSAWLWSMLLTASGLFVSAIGMSL